MPTDCRVSHDPVVELRRGEYQSGGGLQICVGADTVSASLPGLFGGILQVELRWEGIHLCAV